MSPKLVQADASNRFTQLRHRNLIIKHKLVQRLNVKLYYKLFIKSSFRREPRSVTFIARIRLHQEQLFGGTNAGKK